jgi:hypothetical protein
MKQPPRCRLTRRARIALSGPGSGYARLAAVVDDAALLSCSHARQAAGPERAPVGYQLTPLALHALSNPGSR